MAKIDLTKLSDEEFSTLKEDVDTEFEKRQVRLRSEFKDEMKKRAKALGLDLGQMFGNAGPGRPKKAEGDGSRASPAPKYRSLKDPSKTWSGRGLEPKWMKEEKAENKKLKKEDFLIAA